GRPPRSTRSYSDVTTWAGSDRARSPTCSSWTAIRCRIRPYCGAARTAGPCSRAASGWRTMTPGWCCNRAIRAASSGPASFPATRMVSLFLIGGGGPHQLGGRAVTPVDLHLKPDSELRPGNIKAIPGAAGDSRLEWLYVGKCALTVGEARPRPAFVAFAG